MDRTPASLRALLDRLIDYAGLFPPAELPLEEALTRYLAYRRSPDAWMLGPFVLPASRVESAGTLLAGEALEAPVPVILLLPREDTGRAYLHSLRQDAPRLAEQLQTYAGVLSPTWMETRLPFELLAGDGSHAIAAFLTEAHGVLAEYVQPTRIFWEIPWGNAWARWLDRFMDAAVQTGLSELAYKMRCGGMYAEDFPSEEQVATGIVLAREAGLPFKATAGLHQPFRYFDEALGIHHHGFLNLFVAAVLARHYRLSIDECIPVLHETSPETFAFEDAHLGWQDLRAPTEAVREARLHLAHSFGSCSFDEPREALRAHGLLAPLESEIL